MTDAEETVDERDMLSVEAFRRELNSDAARDFFFVWTVAVDSASSATPGSGLLTGALLLLLLAVVLELGWIRPDDVAFIDASSSSSSSSLAFSSLKVCEAFKERARRRRPLIPPLRRADALGDDSIMAAMSLSSLDMRFSAAVKLPCDKGDGRAGRALVLVWEDDVLEVVTAEVVEAMDGRGAVVDDDTEEDEDAFRW